MLQTVRRIVPAPLVQAYHYALAQLAALWYRRPSRDLVVIGVTGTDGKTSTVHILSHILETAGNTTGFITTAALKVGPVARLNAVKQTMPGRFRLQRLLRQMVDAGVAYAIVEATSQGMAQFRHLGVDFSVAVFTNLGTDHIEAHGSLEKYRQAKEKLFAALVRSRPKAGVIPTTVVNLDDPAAPHFLAYPAEERIGFGQHSEQWKTLRARATHLVSASDIVTHAPTPARDGETQFTLIGDDERTQINAPLAGHFNVMNMLAAAAVAQALGVSLPVIRKALESQPGIPGRLERIAEGQNFTLLVDYAHAPEALEAVYTVTRHGVPVGKRLIAVLGSAGGGRGVTKRVVMGKIAARFADIVIVTNEDPYDEDPQQIIRDVAQGAQDAGKIVDQNLFLIDDRRTALTKALALAAAGDVVLVTGKGAEQVMAVAGGTVIPWDDRTELRQLLRERQQ